MRAEQHSPFVPAESGNPTYSSALGTSLAAVVPAQAGTHNHQGFDYRWPCHIALPRRMGPRLRGDDSRESLLHTLGSGTQACRVGKGAGIALLHDKASRAPCPRVVARSASICDAWARRTRGFDIW